MAELLESLRVKGKTHVSVLRREIDDGISWKLSFLKKAHCVMNESGYWWLTEKGLELAEDSKVGTWPYVYRLLNEQIGDDGLPLDPYIRKTTKHYVVEISPGLEVAFSAGVWLNMHEIVTITEQGIARQASVWELRENERNLYNKISAFHGRHKNKRD
jgi:hypothetical protein